MYSAALCQQDCWQRRALDSCGCVQPIDRSLLRDNSTELCNATQIKECLVPLANQALLDARGNDAFQKVRVCRWPRCQTSWQNNLTTPNVVRTALP